MPFVFDESEVEYPEDDTDLPPPRADQFVYLPAPDYSGVRGEVRFSWDPPVDPDGAQQGGTRPKGIFERFFGAWSGSAPQQSQSQEEVSRRILFRRQQSFAVMIPLLRELGVRRVYCRYDGGSDEGFAWIDHAELAGGERLDLTTVVTRLAEPAMMRRIDEAGFAERPARRSAQDHVKDVLELWVATEWAAMLLGAGYGTGEHSLYGAFTADLETGTITDDPAAAPVVQNITLARA